MFYKQRYKRDTERERLRERERERERERLKLLMCFPPPSCILSAARVICLQLSRLDLYYADLSTKDSAFSLNMLPSETLQLASSLSSTPGDAHHVSLIPSASPTTILIKFNTAGVHHQIELGGEEETAVLVSELREGLPLIGWIDGERKWAMDVMLWSDSERNSLVMEFKGEEVEKIEGGGIVATAMRRGPPVFGDVKIFTKSDGSMSYSVAMVMEDFTVIMLKPKGKTYLNSLITSALSF